MRASLQFTYFILILLFIYHQELLLSKGAFKPDPEKVAQAEAVVKTLSDAKEFGVRGLEPELKKVKNYEKLKAKVATQEEAKEKWKSDPKKSTFSGSIQEFTDKIKRNATRVKLRLAEKNLIRLGNESFFQELKEAITPRKSTLSSDPEQQVLPPTPPPLPNQIQSKSNTNLKQIASTEASTLSPESVDQKIPEQETTKNQELSKEDISTITAIINRMKDEGSSKEAISRYFKDIVGIEEQNMPTIDKLIENSNALSNLQLFEQKLTQAKTPEKIDTNQDATIATEKPTSKTLDDLQNTLRPDTKNVIEAAIKDRQMTIEPAKELSRFEQALQQAQKERKSRSADIQNKLESFAQPKIPTQEEILNDHNIENQPLDTLKEKMSEIPRAPDPKTLTSSEENIPRQNKSSKIVITTIPSKEQPPKPRKLTPSELLQKGRMQLRQTKDGQPKLDAIVKAEETSPELEKALNDIREKQNAERLELEKASENLKKPKFLLQVEKEVEEENKKETQVKLFEELSEKLAERTKTSKNIDEEIEQRNKERSTFELAKKNALKKIEEDSKREKEKIEKITDISQIIQETKVKMKNLKKLREDSKIPKTKLPLKEEIARMEKELEADSIQNIQLKALTQQATLLYQTNTDAIQKAIFSKTPSEIISDLSDVSATDNKEIINTLQKELNNATENQRILLGAINKDITQKRRALEEAESKFFREKTFAFHPELKTQIKPELRRQHEMNIAIARQALKEEVQRYQELEKASNEIIKPYVDILQPHIQNELEQYQNEFGQSVKKYQSEISKINNISTIKEKVIEQISNLGNLKDSEPQSMKKELQINLLEEQKFSILADQAINIYQKNAHSFFDKTPKEYENMAQDSAIKMSDKANSLISLQKQIEDVKNSSLLFAKIIEEDIDASNKNLQETRNNLKIAEEIAHPKKLSEEERNRLEKEINTAEKKVNENENRYKNLDNAVKELLKPYQNILDTTAHSIIENQIKYYTEEKNKKEIFGKTVSELNDEVDDDEKDVKEKVTILIDLGDKIEEIENNKKILLNIIEQNITRAKQAKENATEARRTVEFNAAEEKRKLTKEEESKLTLEDTQAENRLKKEYELYNKLNEAMNNLLEPYTTAIQTIAETLD